MILNYKFNKTSIKALLVIFFIGSNLLSANTLTDYSLSEKE